MKMPYAHQGSVILAFLLKQPNVLRQFSSAVVKVSSEPNPWEPLDSLVTASQ